MSSEPKPTDEGLDSGGRKQAILIGIRTFPSIPPERGSPLGGCHNDVARMRECLLAYGFRDADIRILVDRVAGCDCPFCSGEATAEDGAPTREGIRSAVRRLTSALGPDDPVVLYFSGHGSEIAGGGLQAGQRFQTLVPHDSGRGDAPNRDITDWEIEGWIRALGRRTQYATLIFDCCHSGGVTDLRSGDESGSGEVVRRIEADGRPDPDDYDPALRSQLRRRSRRDPSATAARRGQATTRGLGSGSRPLGSRFRGGGKRSVVVLSSSAAHELSRETVGEAGRKQGLFTHHLTRSLQRAHAEGGDDLRWSEVFPEVSRRVQAENLAQHPRRQGDGAIFAVGAVDPDDLDPPEVVELEKLAVVVGIDYRRDHDDDSKSRGFSTLRTPHHDAREVARVLRDVQGYSLVGSSSKNPGPLLGPKATRGRIHRVLQRLAAVKTKTYRETAVVLYFAGHGVVRTESDGQHTGYLIPWGADSEDPSTWLPMKDLRDQLVDGISDPDRLAAMGQRKPLRRLTSRHLLVILDCCFGGALAFDFFRSAGPADRPIYYSEYRRFVEGNAWQMLTSASHNQQALDRNPSDPEQLYSPFAQALIEALTSDGADGGRSAAASDHILTASEIHQYVDRRLAEMGVDLQSPGLMALRPLRGQFVFHVPGYRPSPLPDPPLDPSANPWRQLDSAAEGSSTDATLWGREAEVLELLERFLEFRSLEVRRPEVRRQPGVRGLLLVGPSASGRTTLVEFGLRPILAEPDRARRRLLAWSRRQRRSELLLGRDDLRAARRWIEERGLGSALDGLDGLLALGEPSKKERRVLKSRCLAVAELVRGWARQVGLDEAEEALAAHHQRERLGMPSFATEAGPAEFPWVRRLGMLELLDTPEILCRRLLWWRTRHGLADFLTVSDRALRSLVGRWRWFTRLDELRGSKTAEAREHEEEGVVCWLDPLEDQLDDWPRDVAARWQDRDDVLVIATAGSRGPAAWRAVRELVEGSESGIHWKVVHGTIPDRETLHAIVREPAAAQVLDFDPPELIESLVESVRGSAAPLPLLSETLARMFDRAWDRRGREGRTLTSADLTAADQPAGSMGGWLGRHAETLRGELNRRDPELARSLRRLVLRAIRIESETAHRRAIPWCELDLDNPDERRRVHEVVIPALVRARLAVVGPNTFEWVSDSLFRHWPRLRRALAILVLRPEASAGPRRRARSLWTLWQRAREWQDNGFDSETLWSHGSDLQRLLDAPGLNRLERGFVVASEVERRRRIQSELAMRAVREIPQDWPRAALLARAATRLALDSRDLADRVLRSLAGSRRPKRLSRADRAEFDVAVFDIADQRLRKLRGEDFLRVLQSLHEVLSATPFSIPWTVDGSFHLRGLGFRDRTTLVARLGREPAERSSVEGAESPGSDDRFLVWNLDLPFEPPTMEPRVEGEPGAQGPSVAAGCVTPRSRGPLDPGEDFPTIGGSMGPRAQPDFDGSVRYFAALPVPLPPSLASRLHPPEKLLGHRRVASFLTFSPEGGWLATGSDRQPAGRGGIEIRLWPRVEGSLPRHPSRLPQESLEEALETLRSDEMVDSETSNLGAEVSQCVERFPGRLTLADRVVEVSSEGQDPPHTLVLTDLATGERQELPLIPTDTESEEPRTGDAPTDPTPSLPRPLWPPPDIPYPPWHRRGLHQIWTDSTGRWLVARLDTGEAWVWRTEAGSASPGEWRRVATTGQPTGPRAMRCLAFAPQHRGDEVVLAAASEAGQLWLLERAGTWHQSTNLAMAFPTDLAWDARGHRLALGLRDGSVRVWMEGLAQPDEPPLLLRSRTDGVAVRRLAFGPTGDWLVVERHQTHEPFSTHADLYRLDPETLIELARGHAGRELTTQDLPAELCHEQAAAELESSLASREAKGEDTVAADEIVARGPSLEYLEALGPWRSSESHGSELETQGSRSWQKVATTTPGAHAQGYDVPPLTGLRKDPEEPRPSRTPEGPNSMVRGQNRRLSTGKSRDYDKSQEPAGRSLSAWLQRVLSSVSRWKRKNPREKP